MLTYNIEKEELKYPYDLQKDLQNCKYININVIINKNRKTSTSNS